MMRIMGLLGNKKESQKILNGTWINPIHLYKDTKYIILSMRITKRSRT